MRHAKLNPEQQLAVDTLNGPLLVLAGAGSGKTRVVTQRIVRLIEEGVPAGKILGLTFTNKAAEEMKHRVRESTQDNVLICTFHSLGARILRESIHHLGYSTSFTIYDTQDAEKLMRHCLFGDDFGEKQMVKGALEYVSNAKNALISPDSPVCVAAEGVDKIYADVYKQYQAKLKECNAVDFDDLLYLPVKLFREYPDILDYYQNKWSFLLIDEYQDTNEAQYILSRFLVEKHRNVCVVGDPDQSIYSWRGANMGKILNFTKDYEEAKVIRLEQNYRSTTTILNASNALIQNNFSRWEKNLWSERGAGEKIKWFTADTERGEADFAAERISHFHHDKGLPLKNIAVFYRTNAQSRVVEDSLLSRRIPYVIVGGVSFYQRREIKDILAFLRIVQSGVDFVSFSRTINLPKRGIGEATIEKIHQAASLEGMPVMTFCEALVEGKPLSNPVRLSSKQKEAFRSYLSILGELKKIAASCSLKELVRTTIEQTGYLEHLKLEPDSLVERKENLNALVSKASEWELAAQNPTLEGFLEELSLKSTLDEVDEVKDRVRLMTVHNSKGLEFDLVLLLGMEEDLFPHANSRDSAAAQEEERRLCYVGMTRAKDCLYLCNVRHRMLWGTTRNQRPSRFLDEIPTEYVEKVRLSFPQASHPFSYGRRRPEPEPFIEEAPEPFSDEVVVLQEGDTVFHREFGIGRVNRVYEGSIGLTYKVLFTNDGRERTLVARMAALEKL